MDDIPGGRDATNFNPASGGFLQFIVGDGGLFPALFTDFTDLATGNVGVTLTDSTTDAFNNSSIISFQGTSTDPFFSGSALFTSAGDRIEIFQNSGAASGNFSVSVSAVSGLASIPEPTTFALFGLGVLGCVLRRRRPNGCV